jgi:hypothetical protein
VRSVIDNAALREALVISAGQKCPAAAEAGLLHAIGLWHARHGACLNPLYNVGATKASRAVPTHELSGEAPDGDFDEAAVADSKDDRARIVR